MFNLLLSQTSHETASEIFTALVKMIITKLTSSFAFSLDRKITKASKYFKFISNSVDSN